MKKRERTVSRAYGGSRCANCVKARYALILSPVIIMHPPDLMARLFPFFPLSSAPLPPRSLSVFACFIPVPMRVCVFSVTRRCDSNEPAGDERGELLLLPLVVCLPFLWFLFVCSFCSIMRAFLIEEQKIVKKVTMEKLAKKNKDKK